MKEIEWWLIVIVTIGPTMGVIILTLLSFKLLEVIHKMLETKFGTAIKRIVTLTIAGGDVDNIENIIKAYISLSKTADDIEVDRRLLSYAQKFLDSIQSQKQQIKLLQYEDMLEAKKEFFQILDEKENSDEVLELTNIIDEPDHTFMLEEDDVIKDESVVDDKSLELKT